MSPRRDARSASVRGLSAALAVVLLVLCAAAWRGSQQLHAAIVRSTHATAVADLYQDARFYAATESSAALHDTLQQLGSLALTSSERRAVRQVAAQADRLRQRRTTPLLQSLVARLSALEESHHRQAVTELSAAHHDGVLLEYGAPVVLTLALLLLMTFVVAARRYQRAVERQALNDALTGLPNRRLFADRVTHALADARRTGASPVVLLLDLDAFKDVNDTLGHQCGDQLLVEFARRVRKLLRPGDTVARLGGDEYAVLLTDGGSGAGTEVARRILAALGEPFAVAGISVGMEASIGIAAASPASGAAAPDLLRQADTAMHAAKRERRGCRIYDPAIERATPTRLTLLGELRQALDRDELVLHYQPKIALGTGELFGVEALVRWQHPHRGLIGPGEFIELAEGTTLIHRLTEVVLAKALEFSRSWLDRGRELSVAVNVSARALLEPRFPTVVREQLAEARVSPALLCLELTESAIMDEPGRALTILQSLHDLGVRLSVDDFGTGYSSMSYLKVLPVDELKVDRSFVCDMTTDEADSVIVQSTIDLGHNLGLSVVAEGVEDSGTLEALSRVGVDIVQGYFLGRPMTAAALDQWIQRHNEGFRLTGSYSDSRARVARSR